jgi:diacylglycerol O-acyltransferase 3, plant
MELTGALLRGCLPSPSPGVARGRRRRPARVACARGGFAEEGHLRYYEAAAPRKAVARDLSKIRAMGLVAGDPAREKVLSVSLLFPPLSLSLSAEHLCLVS